MTKSEWVSQKVASAYMCCGRGRRLLSMELIDMRTRLAFRLIPFHDITLTLFRSFLLLSFCVTHLWLTSNLDRPSLLRSHQTPTTHISLQTHHQTNKDPTNTTRFPKPKISRLVPPVVILHVRTIIMLMQVITKWRSRVEVVWVGRVIGIHLMMAHCCRLYGRVVRGGGRWLGCCTWRGE